MKQAMGRTWKHLATIPALQGNPLQIALRMALPHVE